MNNKALEAATEAINSLPEGSILKDALLQMKGDKMGKYLVTVHEHKIYDLWVEASDEVNAREKASESLDEGKYGTLSEKDCWVDISDVASEEEYNSYLQEAELEPALSEDLFE